MSSEQEMMGWPFQAMTFKTGKRETLDAYEANERYAFEQKLDGTRVMVLVTEDGARQVVQRHGEPLKHSASLPSVPGIFKAIGRPPKGWRFVLDGELMWNTRTFVAFDLPCLVAPLMPAITPQSAFLTRRRALEGIYGHLGWDTEVVSLVRHARQSDEKWLLVKDIKDINGEGVLIKDLEAPYGVGTRVGHSLKVKFTKTVDVIVTGVTQGRNEAGNLAGSIEFALFDEPYGKPVWNGSCSAIGRGDVKPGDVIEVEYLAYMAGGGIREPRMLRVREDKKRGECTIAQFVEHSKAVLS
jgi:ATP-dependent DNA ligase